MGEMGTGGGIEERRETLGRLKIGGVCVTQPIDGFTGRTILAKDFIVEADGERPAVRKQDGFFVFSRSRAGSRADVSGMGKGAERLTIRLRGRGYQEKVAEVPITGAGERDDPVVTIMMKPDENYPFPPDTVFMKGMLPAGSCLRAALLIRTANLKLAEDYHAGRELIGLYREENHILTGGIFYMRKSTCLTQNKELPMESLGMEETGNEPEGCFLALGKRVCGKEERYCLQKPLAISFDKRTARLYPAWQHKTGKCAEPYFFAFRAKDGSADAALGKWGKEQECGAGMILCCLETPEGIRECCFAVKRGERKVLDFTEAAL